MALLLLSVGFLNSQNMETTLTWKKSSKLVSKKRLRTFIATFHHLLLQPAIFHHLQVGFQVLSKKKGSPPVFQPSAPLQPAGSFCVPDHATGPRLRSQAEDVRLRGKHRCFAWLAGWWLNLGCFYRKREREREMEREISYLLNIFITYDIILNCIQTTIYYLDIRLIGSLPHLDASQ